MRLCTILVYPNGAPWRALRFRCPGETITALRYHWLTRHETSLRVEW